MFAVNMKHGTACTSQKQKWHEPSRAVLNKVQYEEGRHITFSTSERRKKLKTEVATNDILVPPIPALTDQEQEDFYSKLASSEKEESTPVKSAILAIIPNHASRYIPRTVQLNLPPPLNNLYSDKNRGLPDDEFAKLCDETFENMCITQEQVNHILSGFFQINWC